MLITIIAQYNGTLACFHTFIFKDLVSLVDLAPTFLDIAGIRTPSDMDGLTLLPRMHNHNPISRPYLVIEHIGEHGNPKECPGYHGMGMFVSVFFPK